MNPQGVGLGLMISNSLAGKLGPAENIRTGSKGGLSVESELGIGSTFYFLLENKSNNDNINEDLAESSELDFNEFPDLEKKVLSIKNSNSKSFFKSLDIEHSIGFCSSDDLSKFIYTEKEKKENSEFEELIIKIKNKQCNCEPFLIVDDNDFNLICLSKLLQHFELGSVSAYNGEEAIQRIIERAKNCEICKKYDIVFMDCNMPIKDGYEAANEIKNLENEGKIPKTTVIAASAGENDDIQRCFSCGMEDFIYKPITTINLKNIITKWIKM